jgi:hypothetical protein
MTCRAENVKIVHILDILGHEEISKGGPDFTFENQYYDSLIMSSYPTTLTVL